jgi:hypothetical protein
MTEYKKMGNLDEPDLERDKPGDPEKSGETFSLSDMTLDLMSAKELDKKLTVRSQKGGTLKSPAYDLLRLTADGWSWDGERIVTMTAEQLEEVTKKLDESGVKL